MDSLRPGQIDRIMKKIKPEVLESCKDKNIEKLHLTKAHEMAIESLDPESFESFCVILNLLAKTRKINFNCDFDGS